MIHLITQFAILLLIAIVIIAFCSERGIIQVPFINNLLKDIQRKGIPINHILVILAAVLALLYIFT